jgi:hypothetical protein
VHSTESGPRRKGRTGCIVYGSSVDALVQLRAKAMSDHRGLPLRAAVVGEGPSRCGELVTSLAFAEVSICQVVVISVAEPARWHSLLAGLAGVSVERMCADALVIAARNARGAVQTVPPHIPVLHAASHGWRSAFARLDQESWDVIVFDRRPTRWRDRRALDGWLRA